MRLNTQGRATPLLLTNEQRREDTLLPWISRSEVRGAECKREWNMEGGYLTTLKKITEVIQRGVGQTTGELKTTGLYTGAEF